MAVIEWHEVGGPFSRDEEGGGDVVVIERNFVARADTSADLEMDVEQFSDCPRRGDRHPRNIALRVTSIAVDRREEGSPIFDVAAVYSNRFTPREESNPLSRAAKVSAKSAEFRIPFLRDINRQLVRTTAGEPIIGAETEVNGRVIVVRKNVATWPGWMFRYERSTNSDAVRIRGETFPPRTLRVKNVGVGEDDVENDVLYLPLQFELHHNPLTWLRRFWNRGFWERVDGKMRKITLDDGELPSEPLWIDRQGKAFRDADGNLRDPEPNEVVMLEHKELEELPYNILPLR